MKKFFIFAIIALAFASCTPQQIAKKYGGTTTVNITPDEEVICATFKDDNLWITCKDKNTGEVYMRESSSWGVMEGRVNFKVKEK